MEVMGPISGIVARYSSGATRSEYTMNKPASLNSLPKEERAAWHRHNLQTLAESSALAFEEKMAILEDLEELAIAMGYELDASTGRFRKSNS
jgi:hypothetical protein